jgi:hypothetical protein
MSNVFGFSTEPTGGGDFTPVLKYDARAGRFFRMERVDNNGVFENEPVDITPIVKFIADFDNLETGWILFTPSTAPDFRLVPMGTQLPDRPSPNHKNGIRFMVKLSKDCGGDKPLREIAGTSKAFLSGVEVVYEQYLAEHGKYPGKLPVLVVEKITPVTTGTGAQKSTNYHPTFKISGWSPRGDLVFVPKSGNVPSGHSDATDTRTAPATGSTRAEPPKPHVTIVPSNEMADDDFG